MTDDDELTTTIAHSLEMSLEYRTGAETWDAERIAELRKAGRRAAKLLGRKVRTVQAESSREEGWTNVWIVLVDATEEERDRLMERSRLLMNRRPSPLD